jgi:L-ascorbate metabolism protein UlaG (beta-lactamase superfamily)
MHEALAITWIGHASVLLELDGVRLLTDPVLGDRVGPLRRIAAGAHPSATEDIDAVLLSHLHADHADARSLKRLDPAVTVLAPRGAGEWVRSKGLSVVEELSAGDEACVGEVRVTATPAVHDHRRRPLGATASPIGFVVDGERSCYFAGDTDLFDAMSDMAGDVDVALLPLWGWGKEVRQGHLDPERAAEAAARIAPRVVIPIHWGTLAPPRPLPRTKDLHQPVRAFAALMARRAPGVDVRVLAPGERTAIA